MFMTSLDWTYTHRIQHMHNKLMSNMALDNDFDG